MKIRRVEHIAVAVHNLSEAMRIFQEKFGLALEYEEHFPRYETKIAMYPVGETYLELLQGTAPTSDVTRWVDSRGQGLYHICLEVDDIEDALAELRDKGVRLLDEHPRVGHKGTRIAFLDPRSTADVLIELVQIPPQRGAEAGLVPEPPR